MADGLIQRHFANLRHIREFFRIDPRVGRGTGQIAPWLSGVVQLVHPAFPGSFSFLDTQVVILANPAAGANFLLTIPPQQTWALRCVQFTLATDANAANREPQLLLDDGANSFFRVTPVSVQVASISRNYFYGKGLGYETSVGSNKTHGLPDVVMRSGFRIQSAIVSIQVGDQVSGVRVLVDVFAQP